MRHLVRATLPSLVLAAGILVATAAAVLTEEHGWWVLVGPGLMVVAVLAATAAGRRFGGRLQPSYRAAWIHAASFVLAGVIVALRDPGLVPMLVPLLGGTTLIGLGSSPCRRGRDAEAAA